MLVPSWLLDLTLISWEQNQSINILKCFTKFRLNMLLLIKMVLEMLRLIKESLSPAQKVGTEKKAWVVPILSFFKWN
jgi:hypothetical protein